MPDPNRLIREEITRLTRKELKGKAKASLFAIRRLGKAEAKARLGEMA